MKISLRLSRPTRPLCCATQRGLTLLELLVVLGILAVLAGLALRSVTGLFDQRRFEANAQQLQELEQAVLDDAGFVADIGRLPLAQSADPLDQLSELWQAGALPAFSIQNAPGDPEVRLGAGWRGPYLRLPSGADTLRDAFGFEKEHFQANGAPAAGGNTVAIVRSLGADGLPGGEDYDLDLVAVFEAEAGAVTAGLADQPLNRWQRDVVVTIHRGETGQPAQAVEGDRVLIRVYGPNGAGLLRTIASETLTVTGGILTSTFASLPHGPKIFRAYQADSIALPPGDDDPFASTPAWRSPATTVQVERSLSAAPVPLILQNF